MSKAMSEQKGFTGSDARGRKKKKNLEELRAGEKMRQKTIRREMKDLFQLLARVLQIHPKSTLKTILLTAICEVQTLRTKIAEQKKTPLLTMSMNLDEEKLFRELVKTEVEEQLEFPLPYCPLPPQAGAAAAGATPQHAPMLLQPGMQQQYQQQQQQQQFQQQRQQQQQQAAQFGVPISFGQGLGAPPAMQYAAYAAPPVQQACTQMVATPPPAAQPTSSLSPAYAYPDGTSSATSSPYAPPPPSSATSSPYMHAGDSSCTPSPVQVHAYPGATEAGSGSSPSPPAAHADASSSAYASDASCTPSPAYAHPAAPPADAFASAPYPAMDTMTMSSNAHLRGAQPRQPAHTPHTAAPQPSAKKVVVKQRTKVYSFSRSMSMPSTVVTPPAAAAAAAAAHSERVDEEMANILSGVRVKDEHDDAMEEGAADSAADGKQAGDDAFLCCVELAEDRIRKSREISRDLMRSGSMAMSGDILLGSGGAPLVMPLSLSGSIGTFYHHVLS